MRFARVSGGNVLDSPPFKLPPVDEGQTFLSGIAALDSTYLVAWYNVISTYNVASNYAYATVTIVDTEGRAKPIAESAMLPGAELAAVASDSTQYLLAYLKDGAIHAVTADASGTPTSDMFEIASKGPDDVIVSVGVAGGAPGNFLVYYVRESAAGKLENLQARWVTVDQPDAGGAPIETGADTEDPAHGGEASADGCGCRVVAPVNVAAGSWLLVIGLGLARLSRRLLRA